MFFFKYLFANSKRHTLSEKFNKIWHCFKHDHENLYNVIDFIIEFLSIYYIPLFVLGITIFAYLAVKYNDKKNKTTKTLQNNNQLDDENTHINSNESMISQKKLLKEDSMTSISCEICPISSIQRAKCKYCGKKGHDLENCTLRDKVLYDIKLKQESFKIKNQTSNKYNLFNPSKLKNI